MSETATETRAQKRAREAREAEAAAGNSEGTSDSEAKPDGEAKSEAELTPEQKAERDEIAAIEGFSLAAQLGEEGDTTFAKSTTPVRSRNAIQTAMDKVAVKAYSDWVAAGRPTLWQNMPVITYFLDPEKVEDRRKIVRKACEVVTPESYEKDGKLVEPSGVRVRFGNEFVLTEKMAHKIGKPDEAGKTVLAWAAIDKRLVNSASDN